MGYTYDARGRLSVISDPARGNLAQYTYDAASNVTRRDTLLNGSYLTYDARDALNRMPSRAIVVGGVAVSNETYGYDNMNRLTSTDRSEDNKRDAFTYDYESQMTSAQYGLVNLANPTRTVGYTLDLLGNRTNVTDGGFGYTYTPNNINQYTGNVGADPVVNGNDPGQPSGQHTIVSYKNVNYGYINDGRLTSVSSNGNSYAIKYDAFGRTVSRTLNGATTYYYYDGEKAIVETGATTASNVYGLGIDEILLRFEGATTRCFYQDHEGSVTHVATGNTVVESYRYDAFGAPSFFGSSGGAIAASAINNRFLFTGREWNQTFGFYEYRARAYHPVLGRFMSEDPKGFDAGDYNLFRYCGNDPEDKVDPSGLDGVKPLDLQREKLILQHGGPLERQTDPIQAFIRKQNGYGPDASQIERAMIRAGEMSREASSKDHGTPQDRTARPYASGVYVGKQDLVISDPAPAIRVEKGQTGSKWQEDLTKATVHGKPIDLGEYHLAAIGHYHKAGSILKSEADWTAARGDPAKGRLGVPVLKNHGDSALWDVLVVPQSTSNAGMIYNVGPGTTIIGEPKPAQFPNWNY